MKVLQKINMDKQGLIENGPITIVAFGDMVGIGQCDLLSVGCQMHT